MHAFFMGSRQRRLFAVYDAPPSSSGVDRAVVLCAPWGQEYLTSHRSFRRLALELSNAGSHVLRFDWYGCGDSAGGGRDGDVDGWLTDLGTAIEELKAISGASTVCLVGLRLGATLGWQTAAVRADASRVVLWDPVVSGREYVTELLTMERAASAAIAVGESADGSVDQEVLGFEMTAGLRKELEAIELDAAVGLRIGSTLLIGSEERADYTGLHGRLLDHGVAHEFETASSPLAWVEQPQMAAGVVPVPLLETIVGWVGETQ